MRFVSTVQVKSAIRDDFDGFSGSDDGDDDSGFDPSATILDWAGDPCEDMTMAKAIAIGTLQHLHQKLAALEAQMYRASKARRESSWYRVRVGHRASLLAQISDAQDRLNSL